MTEENNYASGMVNLFQDTEQAGSTPSSDQGLGFQGAKPAADINQAAHSQQAPQSPEAIYSSNLPYQQLNEHKSHGWIVAIVVVVCLLIFALFAVSSCSRMLGSFGLSSIDSSLIADNSIAVIDVDGTIQYDGTTCSPEGLSELLSRASSNSSIKAVVLRINSGGGTSTAGEEMAGLVKDFPKPIVVSSASINASAAYEISAQADYIFTAKTSEIGAIGTAMQISDISGLLDMLGVDINVITSSQSKDSSYGYRALTDDEYAYYQRMVDQINDLFIEEVASGRNMSIDDVRALATGLPFTGLDAVENGLADEIGTLDDATEKAAELAGVSNYEVCTLALGSYSLSTLEEILLGQSFYDQLTNFLQSQISASVSE